MKINLPTPKDYTERFDYDDIKSCRFECACACTGFMFFIPLASVPDSKYGRYIANQGFIILLLEFAAMIAGFLVGLILNLLALIPFVGIVFTVIKISVGVLLWALVLFCIIYSMVNMFKGRARDLPIIGRMRFIK